LSIKGLQHLTDISNKSQGAPLRDSCYFKFSLLNSQGFLIFPFTFEAKIPLKPNCLATILPVWLADWWKHWAITK